MAKKLSSGQTFEEVTGEEGERLRRNYTLFGDGVIKVLPEGWCLPTTFQKFADLIYNFEVRKDDVFINTFPKSGTHWITDIAWNLIHNPNLDNPNANLTFDARCPNFEVDMIMAVSGQPQFNPEGETVKAFKRLCPGRDPSDGLFIHLAAKEPPPRLLKNHLPLCFLPPNILNDCKTIYMARNPKDVAVSFYHFMRLHILFSFKGTLDEYIDDLVNGNVIFGPYWEHLKTGWEKRNHPNVCFIFYEDLKEDAFKETKRIDRFLGTNLSDTQIKNIVDHCSFAKMKERNKDNPPSSNDNKLFNKSVEEEEGGFFRKGIVGDWKNKFTSEQVQKLDAWIKKNVSQFEDDFKYKEKE